MKEYKVLDKAIMGVRRAESTKRAARYTEPTECRFYGSKKDHVEAFYPILDWSDDDVVAFIEARGIRLYPLYYREDGSIDPSRRLGCMCCPLASVKKRIEQFKERPGMVRAYIKAGEKWRNTHPNVKSIETHPTVYHQFIRDVFFENQKKYEDAMSSMFGEVDCKKFLEEYFISIYNGTITPILLSLILQKYKYLHKRARKSIKTRTFFKNKRTNTCTFKKIPLSSLQIINPNKKHQL